MKIITGKVIMPPKVILYGPEGIGKSTLASRFPNPVFIDVEGGTTRLDVARIDVRQGGYAAVVQAIQELAVGSQGYKTLVIDTTDWLDAMVTEKVCQKAGKDGIEDFGYGKGYVYVKEEWSRLLDMLDAMQKKNGMGIVFCAHAWMKAVSLPDETGTYDHWEMKMQKFTAPLLREWVEFQFFIKYDTIIIEDKDTKRRRGAGGQRVICTTHTPFWDAKSRERLPETIRYDEAGYRTIMAAIYPATTATAPAAAAAPPQPPSVQPSIPMERANAAFRDAQEAAKANQAPAEAVGNNHEPADKNGDGTASANTQASGEGKNSPEKTAMLDQLREVMKISGVSMKELDAYMAAAGIVPAGTLPYDYNDDTLRRLIGRWDEVKKTIIERRTK